jgi:hypothetical protein
MVNLCNRPLKINIIYFHAQQLHQSEYKTDGASNAMLVDTSGASQRSISGAICLVLLTGTCCLSTSSYTERGSLVVLLVYYRVQKLATTTTGYASRKLRKSIQSLTDQTTLNQARATARLKARHTILHCNRPPPLELPKGCNRCRRGWGWGWGVRDYWEGECRNS